MESPPFDSNEAAAARVRLMALLALYDRLPPSIDGIAVPDFNPPPNFDSENDAVSIIHSLDAISKKLHIQSLESFMTLVFAAGHRTGHIGGRISDRARPSGSTLVSASLRDDRHGTLPSSIRGHRA